MNSNLCHGIVYSSSSVVKLTLLESEIHLFCPYMTEILTALYLTSGAALNLLNYYRYFQLSF